MVNLLVAAALATASAQPVAPASADPALFVVGDADTTVYIFGTFHALDGRSEWFHNKVRNAFDSSGELVLETLVPEGPGPILLPAMRTPAPPLRGVSVTPSASFLATTRMAIDAGRSQGMKVGYGADMILRQAAENSGKQVEGLETLESQLNMFTQMPASTSPPAASASGRVDDGARDSLSKSMVDMQAAWNRGDQNVFVHMLDKLSRASPDTYRMLFTERNSRWADWIAARLQTPGTVFVAVGAGHLAGKDSVLVRLAEQGIESQRLN